MKEEIELEKDFLKGVRFVLFFPVYLIVAIFIKIGRWGNSKTHKCKEFISMGDGVGNCVGCGRSKVWDIEKAKSRLKIIGGVENIEEIKDIK